MDHISESDLDLSSKCTTTIEKKKKKSKVYVRSWQSTDDTESDIDIACSQVPKNVHKETNCTKKTVRWHRPKIDRSKKYRKEDKGIVFGFFGVYFIYKCYK